ncbi:MAG: M23 family metallopeptidase [Paludibacteraceae bacterium]|nr:M23 family metallopeptidase [Paludibacteraceae bacterium]
MKRLTKYRINPDTLLLEKVERSILSWIGRTSAVLFIGIGVGIGFFFLFHWLFPSPEEARLRQQNRMINQQMQVMERRTRQLQTVVNDLGDRDRNLYRVLLGTEPLTRAELTGEAQRTAYYDSIAEISNSRLYARLIQSMDQLEAQVYQQSASYDDLVRATKNQSQRMECIPAIQPVMNKDLKRMASGYGWRVDPVYHVRRFHAGMDFTAPSGTEVMATGNGVVEFVGWKQGYGNTVIINHGFGYETLYAHLSKQLCRVGQQVVRGDIIAEVGSTGKSTGPHLHYEVHVQGQHQDPSNYYFYDLSPEQYDQMLRLTQNSGDMLD